MRTEEAAADWDIVSRVDPAAQPVPIVVTVGPAVFDPARGLDLLAELVEDGVSAFRVNFSHVTPEGGRDIAGNTRTYSYATATRVIERIRVIEREHKTPIPVLMDLKGPDIRVRQVSIDGALQDCLPLSEGDVVLVTQAGDVPGAGKNIQVEFDGDFAREVIVGNLVRIDDGRVELSITAAGPVTSTRATREGTVLPGKSVNLPGRHLATVNSVTERDRADIAQCFDVDIVAQSFVRDAADIGALRDALVSAYGDKARNPARRPVPVIVAKIETEEAVLGITKPDAAENAYLRILGHEWTFGVMVARGDLGGELGVARVPAIQERLLSFANRMGKPAIVATQLLESMMKSPVPLRAEVGDIWNAVREGADAVMLSGETAGGAYPRQAVRQMKAVLDETRVDTDAYRRKFDGDYVYGRTEAAGTMPQRAVDVVGFPAVSIAEEAGSPFLVTYATTGASARRIARFRPREPIAVVALTARLQTARVLRLLYAVYPVLLAYRPEARNDLPRARQSVIDLSHHVIRQLVRDNDRLAARLGPDWEKRFIVATLADESPDADWDTAQEIVVFRYGLRPGTPGAR